MKNYFDFMNDVVFPLVKRYMKDIDCYPCALDGDSGNTITGFINERKVYICVWTYGFSIHIQPENIYESYQPNNGINFESEFMRIRNGCYVHS